MSDRLRRDLDLALEAFYRTGQHTFWQVFAETPKQAVAALTEKPEVFGILDPQLVGIERRRLHSRVIQLALALLHRHA